MNDYNKQGKLRFNMAELKERIGIYIDKFKNNPTFAFVVIGFGLIFIYFIFFSNSSSIPKVHPLQEKTVPFEDIEMIGVKDSVDPRDVWTAKVEQRVKASKEALDQEVKNRHQESIIELEKIKQELLMLKDSINQQKISFEKKQIEENVRLSNNSLNNYQAPQAKASKTLGVFTKDYGSKKRNFREYVTSGTFARAVLTTGIVVGTGSNSASDPEPVRLRLTDVGILSKNLRTEQIKEAILIGDCRGDLSSERAKCRLQTLSLENIKGEIIERPVQGWVFGEDGRYGVKGIVVDKSSDMLRMAMLNGLLGGISNFFQSQATKGSFPISALTGQQNSLSAISTLKGGVAHGAGDAFAKMADFVMDRFNAMSPQIVVASGREVDVVFQHGVDLNGIFNEEQQKIPDGNLREANHYNDSAKQNNNYSNEANNFNETLQQMNSGMNHQETEDGF